MSTKIYNVWLTFKTLNVLHSQLRSLQLKEMATYQAYLDRCLKTCKTDEHRLEQCFCDMRQVLMGYNGSPECSAVIYPYPSRAQGWTPNARVVHLCGVTRDNQKSFVRSVQGKDIHYQNQTDEPEGMSEAEWDRRKKIWDIMMPSGTPSEDGFIFDLISKRKALELILARTRLAVPPLNQPSEGGKPWREWGPRAFGYAYAWDAERAWNQNGRRAFKEFEIKLTRSMLRIEETSLDCSML